MSADSIATITPNRSAPAPSMVASGSPCLGILTVSWTGSFLPETVIVRVTFDCLPSTATVCSPSESPGMLTVPLLLVITGLLSSIITCTLLRGFPDESKTVIVTTLACDFVLAVSAVSVDAGVGCAGAVVVFVGVDGFVGVVVLVAGTGEVLLVVVVGWVGVVTGAGATIPMLNNVRDSPGLFAVSCPLPCVHVTIGVVVFPLIYRAILVRDSFAWLPAAPVAVSVISGKFTVNVPVAAPVQTPVTTDGEALLTLEVETILLTVMPPGAVLVEVIPDTVNGAFVVRALSAVAVIVDTIVAHSIFVL